MSWLHREEWEADYVDDLWATPFLDKWTPPALISQEELSLKKKLRRMRKRARLSDSLIKANRELRKQLKGHVVTLEGGEYEPDDHSRTQVASLASAGLSKQGIAVFMGISVAMLNKHYENELTLGRVHGDLEVLKTFKAVATTIDHPGVVTAGKKWLESRVEGWKDVKQVEVKNPEQRPTIDVRALDPLEREQFKALLEKMAAAQMQITDQSVIAEQDAGITP